MCPHIMMKPNLNMHYMPYKATAELVIPTELVNIKKIGGFS